MTKQFTVPIHRSYVQIEGNKGENGGRILAYTPKAGSTSIYRALKSFPMRNSESVRRDLRDGKCSEVILFVRHPLERLVSTWWMFKHQNRGSLPPKFDAFADKVLTKVRHNADHHWIPQADFHTYKDRFLPTTLYRFEHLQEIWPQLLTGHDLGWYNRGIDRPHWQDVVFDLPLELQAGLQQYYAEDLLLHEIALTG